MKRRSSNFAGQSKVYAQALLQHLNISGATRLAQLVDSPLRILEFGEKVWQLEKLVREQPGLRADDSGVRFWLSWHEAEREWRVSLVHSVQVRADDGTLQTKNVLVVGGAPLTGTLKVESSAPVATL